MPGVTTRSRTDHGASRPAARNADALPRHDATPPHAGRTAFLGILGSLVLLVGVPVGLVLFVGNPLPTEPPSSSWLTADLSASMLIDVLAVVVWVVWVHFVVCFLTEWRACAPAACRAASCSAAVPRPSPVSWSRASCC